jgi:imidazole glycerol-phosphate synthase subunit HisF
MTIYNRVIPVLLLMGNGIYKTVRFESPKYIGDPINAVKIFNEKEVDELILIDIIATSDSRKINYDLINNIASEAFMPICYGGGINRIDQINKLLKIGIEKVSINTQAINDISFIKDSAENFGSSTIVVSIDIRKNIFGKFMVYTNRGTKNTGLDPIEFANDLENMGAGELLITSINQEGTLKGYEINILKKITEQVGIPVIANGGGGGLKDMNKVISEANVSAVSAGSMFVYYGKHKAVLINYPDRFSIENLI